MCAVNHWEKTTIDPSGIGISVSSHHILPPPVPWHASLPLAFQCGLARVFGTLTWRPPPHRPPMLTRNCLLLFLWFLIDKGSLSPVRPPTPPLTRSRLGREHPRSLLGPPMRNGAAGFQRVKRGWVWNQFFVLEEYMGSDPQYVGKVRSQTALECL